RLHNSEFVRCGEALPAGSTHLIERPLLLDGERALHFLACALRRLRDAFYVLAGEGVRLPEIATARPVFELRLAGTLFSVTGELMCMYGDRAPIKALANAQDQFVFRDPQNVDRVLMRNLDAENAAIARLEQIDRKSTRLNSSHQIISYAVFCLKKKTIKNNKTER